MAQLTRINVHLSAEQQRQQRLRTEASSKTPTESKLDDRGMPVDRTVCPACHNRDDSRAGCATCDGFGVVCPECRGARWVVEVKGGQHNIQPGKLVACGCMVRNMATEKMELSVDNEAERIRQYRAAQPIVYVLE